LARPRLGFTTSLGLIGLSAGGRLKARRKTANGLTPPLRNERTNERIAVYYLVPVPAGYLIWFRLDSKNAIRYIPNFFYYYYYYYYHFMDIMQDKLHNLCLLASISS